MTYMEIQGWFDFNAYYDLALERLIDLGRDSTLVEVGCWKGKSTIYLANLIKTSQSNIKQHFYAVDTWKGSTEHKAAVDAAGGDLFNEFMHNCQCCGVSQFVYPIRKQSLEAVQLFDSDSVDFCFLDASHEYVDIFDDIISWWDKIRHGGYLAGHDFYWGEVALAVRKFVKENPGHEITLHGSCWEIQKI